MKKYFNNNKHPLLGCPLARDDAQRFILPVHKIVSYFSLPSCCFYSTDDLRENFNSTKYLAHINDIKSTDKELKYNANLSHFLSNITSLIKENKTDLHKAQLAIEKE